MKTRKEMDAKAEKLLGEMTAQHTPGPWMNNGGQIEHEMEQGPNVVIGTVGQVNNQSTIDTANARLIAAAPELLVYAMVRYRQLRTECDVPDKNGYVAAPDSVARVELRMLRDLIAKAEGR